MQQELKKAILSYIQSNDPDGEIVKITPKPGLVGGEIAYSKEIHQWETINSLRQSEEWVRAYLVCRLVKELDYPASCLELEKRYPVGRPKVQKPELDVLVKRKPGGQDDPLGGKAFMMIECKDPDKYERDGKHTKDEFIRDQLFALAGQEAGLKYLIYYSADILDGIATDKSIIIDYSVYRTFEEWKKDQSRSLEVLPFGYQTARKRTFVKEPSEAQVADGATDLKRDVSRSDFQKLRLDLHNVLWGGGEVAYNDIFTNLVRLLLAKVYDEHNTDPGEEYEFQVKLIDGRPETAAELFERMNSTEQVTRKGRRVFRGLFRRAQQDYLLQPPEVVKDSAGIDRAKFGEVNTVNVVKRFQAISLTRNSHKDEGDLLGEFFEQIVSNEFKQTKGQFFTHPNIVRFILMALKLDEYAVEVLRTQHRLPTVCDPSCGSGTFLIEAMKLVTKSVLSAHESRALRLNDVVRPKFDRWFLPRKPHSWAAEFLYGIEINHDLALATKVNMVLHGDGNTNIYSRDGLLPFLRYQRLSSNGQTENTLLTISTHDPSHPYPMPLNEQFDFVVSNPPFSLDKDSLSQEVQQTCVYSDKANSENLFFERWYQLLAEGGRLGVVLPDSVFDTTENRYIRLFLYRFFIVKAVISLPAVAFELGGSTGTSTRTSVLLAVKKTEEEVIAWDAVWNQQAKDYKALREQPVAQLLIQNDILRERLLRYMDRAKVDTVLKVNLLGPSSVPTSLVDDLREALGFFEPDEGQKITGQQREFEEFLVRLADFSQSDHFTNLASETKDTLRTLLRTYYDEGEDDERSPGDICEKYYDELTSILVLDWPMEKDAQPYANSWWVFSGVSKHFDDDIFFAEAANIGYKRRKRGEADLSVVVKAGTETLHKRHDLFDFEVKVLREKQKEIHVIGDVLVNSQDPVTILDFVRQKVIL